MPHIYLFFRAEIFFSCAAELACEIIGKIFPFRALLVFIIDPAAEIADVFHIVLPSEVSFEKACECLAVAGFVACHFMNGVVESIEIVLLAELCEFELAEGCAVFGFYTHFKVLLCAVGHDFAEELSELCCVLCFFKAGLFPVHADFGITFTVCNTCHSEVHSYFAALTCEVCLQAFNDLCFDVFRNIRTKLLAYTNNMLSSPGELTLGFGKLAAGNLALGAELRGLITFMHITANRADPFFSFLYPPLKK